MEKIRDRIRKLLRLARDKGASEAEAATAMAMASKLMLEYNIEHVEDEVDNEIIKGEWLKVDRGGEDWEKRVGTAVGTMFNCRFIHDTAGFGWVKFVGKPNNVEVCGDVYEWWCNQVEQYYKLELKKHEGTLNKTLRAQLRRNFKAWCSLRISQRVGEIMMANRGNIPDHLALVVIDQSLAKADEMLKDVPKGKELSIPDKGIGRKCNWLGKWQ